MHSNLSTFVAAEDAYRRDRAQREIAEAALRRRFGRGRRSRTRQS